MKVLVGTDIGAYAFDAALGKITFTGLPVLSLEQVLVITHVSSGTIIYNFADPNKGGTILDAVLDLDYNTSALLGTELQIWIYLSVGDLPSVTDIAYANGVVSSVNKTFADGTILRTIISYANGKVSKVTNTISVPGDNNSVMGVATLPFTLGA